MELIPPGPNQNGESDPPPSRFVAIFHSVEAGLLTAVLGLMVLLPVTDVFTYALEGLLRHLNLDLGLRGIAGTIPIVQHLVLVLGLLGAAIAARQNRLLAINLVVNAFKGRWKLAAVIASNSVAAAVTATLCVAGFQFAITQRSGGDILVYGIPTWSVQMLIPIALALITWRLVTATTSHKWSRLGIAAGALLCAGAIYLLGSDPDRVRGVGIAAVLLALALGAPLYTAIGGAALLLFWSQGDPISVLTLEHYRISVNPMLPTIPLFTLAGYFLAEGGASSRLIRVFETLVGHFRGGPAILCVVVCAFFTSFTGASGVTILALGGLLMPVLRASKFSEKSALGLLTGSGSLGLLFPPCIPLILYAIVASDVQTKLETSTPYRGKADAIQQADPTLDLENLDSLDLEHLDRLPGGESAHAPAAESGGTGPAEEGTSITIESMFLAGIVPGILLVILTSLWGRNQGARPPPAKSRFQAKASLRAALAAKWELLLPVVALVAIFGGFASTVQAAALTAAYAFVVEALVYRDLALGRNLIRVMSECGTLIGGVLLILGVAQGFNNYLITEQVPQRLLQWVQQSVTSPLVFLLILNVFLLVVGCLMDIYSAIVVVVPLIIPMGLAFGINPVHLGIIFLANLELGYLTPPVGLNLFLAAYRFNKDLVEVYRSIIPIFFVLLFGVLLITYVPFLTTFLPRLLLGR